MVAETEEQRAAKLAAAEEARLAKEEAREAAEARVAEVARLAKKARALEKPLVPTAEQLIGLTSPGRGTLINRL